MISEITFGLLLNVQKKILQCIYVCLADLFIFNLNFIQKFSYENYFI